MVAILASAASRHRVHSKSSRFRITLYTVTRAAGHDDLRSVTSRKPFVRAIASNAGNQCSACESPNNISVVRLSRSPYSHCRTRATPAGVARVRQCEYGDRDSRTTLILFGDSHAEHWFPAFDAIARTKGLRLVTLLKSSCPAARVTVYSVTLKREDFECTRWREAALARIATMKPYMVILSEKDSVVSKNPVAGAGRLPI